jgi:hypothetical protein
MAAPTRTKAQRVKNREEIAILLAEGMSGPQIARELKLSLHVVNYDTKLIKDDWRTRMAAHADVAQAKQLAQIDHVLNSAYAMLKKGIGPHEVKTAKFTEIPAKGKGQLAKKVSTSTITVEELAGDPQVLAVILKALEQKAKILGLNSPEKIEHAGPDGSAIPVALKDMEATLQKIYGAGA